MKMLIHHCNKAIVKDKKGKRGRADRNGQSFQYPENPGEADVRCEPVMDGPKVDQYTKTLLTLFQHIDLRDTFNSPILINYRFLSEKTGLSQQQLDFIFYKLYEMRILQTLTIDYDHEKWLKHSFAMGYLLVMICIEAKDYERVEPAVQKATLEIIKVGDMVAKKRKIGNQIIIGDIRSIILVPNVHLTSKPETGRDSKKNIHILKELKKNLELHLKDRKISVHLTSYGYSKLFDWAVDASKVGYVFRSI